jgi:hypothetical protein
MYRGFITFILLHDSIDSYTAVLPTAEVTFMKSTAISKTKTSYEAGDRGTVNTIKT